MERGVDLFLVDESYTSATCGICGKLKRRGELGSNKTYRCNGVSGCGIVIDRDVNGARNILIKNLKRKFLLKLKERSFNKVRLILRVKVVI